MGFTKLLNLLMNIYFITIIPYFYRLKSFLEWGKSEKIVRTNCLWAAVNPLEEIINTLVLLYH